MIDRRSLFKAALGGLAALCGLKSPVAHGLGWHARRMGCDEDDNDPKVTADGGFVVPKEFEPLILQAKPLYGRIHMVEEIPAANAAYATLQERMAACLKARGLS